VELEKSRALRKIFCRGVLQMAMYLSTFAVLLIKLEEKQNKTGIAGRI
jgi:hypothetical protein